VVTGRCGVGTVLDAQPHGLDAFVCQRNAEIALAFVIAQYRGAQPDLTLLLRHRARDESILAGRIGRSAAASDEEQQKRQDLNDGVRPHRQFMCSACRTAPRASTPRGR
jgi:hypothetical protein